MMLVADKGDKYFLKSKNKAKDGNIDPSLGLQYIKADEWELKPVRKGLVPQDSGYEHPEGAHVHRRE